MNKSILNLIDFEKVNKLLEGFNQSTGFVTAILDLEGNVLSKSGWRQICSGFHRLNAETSKKCTISDTVLARELGQGEKYHFYKCLNGLVDVAVPIVINGEHIANLFSGQFFFEEPDPAFFEKQAGTYGFSESEYMAALKDVPIVSKEKVKQAMDFLLNMTQLISEITFQKLEQVQLNNALKKSEERSRSVLDQMLEGCQIIGFDWRYIYLNRTAEVHNRRSKDELIGKCYADMWPGIEETEVYRIIKQTLETRIPSHFENEFIFPDGSRGWFDLSIQPIPEGVFILSIDITERKIVENALRESEEKYRLISDNSDDWIYWIAPDSHMLYVSPACERVTGYSPAEFAYNPELNLEIVYDADKEKVRNHTQISELDNTPHDLEFRILTKEGEIRWVRHSCSPIFGNNGEYLGRRGTNRNITERKRQEEQLFESEFRFNKLYENGPFGMVMADKDFRFKKVNAAFCAILGYSEDELTKITFKDITHPDDQKKDLLNVKKLNNNEIPVYKTEKRYLHKDGHEVWGSLTATATYNSEGKFLYNLGIIEDITHRKQVEEELKKSKKLLSETESIGKVGGWEFNIDTFATIWTDEVYRIHEVDFDFNHNVKKSINFYTGESKPVIEKAVQRAVEAGESFDLELEIITAKGNLRKVHAIGKADLANRRVYGFFQDITERKLVEDQLRNSEQRFSSMFNLGPVAKSLARVSEMTIADFNKAAELMFEIKRDEVVNKFVEKFDFWAVPEERMVVREILKKQGFIHGFEFQYKTTTGKTGWASGYAEIIEINGEKYSYNEYVDITKRKLAEEELLKTRNQLEKIFETSPGIVCTSQLRPDGTVCFPYGGERLAQYFGIPTAHLEEDASPYLALIHPDDLKSLLESIEKSASKLTPWRYEWRMLHPSKGLMWIEGHSMPEREQDGSTLWHGVATDISERKRAEEVLREREYLLSSSQRAAHIGTWSWKIGDATVYWSDETYRIYGLSPQMGPPDFEFFFEIIHPEDRHKMRDWPEAVIAGLHPSPVEFRVLRPDGIYRVIRTEGDVIDTIDGVPSRIAGTAYDITERKQAEEALKKSKQLLSETESIGKVGGWEFNIDTMEQIWTDEVYRIHEVDLDFHQNVSKGINFYTPSSRPIIDKAVQRVIEFGEPYDLELEIITAKGNVRSVHTIGKADLENRRIYGFFQDITERKKLEESLLANEARLRNVFEQASDGIYIINTDNQYIDVNEKGLELLGYTRDELLQMNVSDVLHPDEVARLAIEPPRMMSGVPHLAEWIHIRKDGSSFPGEVSARKLNDHSYLAIIRDLTERKHAEKEIKLLNERIVTATKASQVGIWDWDIQNNILTWDDQMYLLYGLKKEEFTGAFETWVNGLHPDDRESSQSETNLALAGEKEYDTEFRVIWPDGSIHFLMAKGEVTRNETGNPIRMVGINYDITDRKKVEEEIKKLNESLEIRVEERTAELKEVNQELEAFSYSVSHDLRAPLRHINGFVDMLKDDFTDLLPEKGKHYLDVIVNSSRDMGTLIDDLLQFSRTGRQELKVNTMDMNTVLKEVLNSFERDIQNRKIEWEISELPETQADYSLMRMVWQNLLSNAIKFTKDKEPAQIQIGFRDEGDEYAFFVKDNGAGFDMRYAHKLFGVFQRLHSKQEFEGTGIGLANVRRIILKHGGRTWAESKLDEGATIYFSLLKPSNNRK